MLPPSGHYDIKTDASICICIGIAGSLCYKAETKTPL